MSNIGRKDMRISIFINHELVTSSIISIPHFIFNLFFRKKMMRLTYQTKLYVKMTFYIKIRYVKSFTFILN